MSGWENDDHVERLKSLWVEGLSASQVADRLNRSFSDASYSRNAVIGKVHRLGLGGRASASTPAMHRTRPTAATVRKPSTPKVFGSGTVLEHPQSPNPPRVVIPFQEDEAGTATVLTLGVHACRWPLGDPLHPDFSFCGQRRDGERPYCATHSTRAYQSEATSKKRSAAELARSLRRYV